MVQIALVTSRAFVLAALVLAGSPGKASADESRDGLYGRWDRDLVLALGAGGGATVAGGDAAPIVAGEARLRFLGAAGPVVSGAWARGAQSHLFVGVELRPLFPALFLLDLSTNRPFVDLLLQSISVELGPAFLLDGHGSTGLGVGLALEVPLIYPTVFAQGLWLRLDARRVLASAEWASINGPTRSHWALMATLVVALGIDAGLVDLEPPRYR
jgi:hypothetical protein